MKINLITNLNGVGLEFDAKILASILTEYGHACKLVQYDKQSDRTDLNIFFEILEHAQKHIPNARHSVFIPNPEWLIGWHGTAGKMREIWVKSPSALRPFSNLNKRVKHLGFTSRDMFREGAKQRTFFHLAGKSDAKHTALIMRAWQANPNFPELTVVIHPDKAGKLGGYARLKNVRVIARYLTDDELAAEMNRHLFHLCPSRVEGWGHYIVEAMSTGAVVLATDGAPMNEHITPDRGILIPVTGQEVIRKAFAYKTDYGRISDACKKALAMTAKEIGEMRTNARIRFQEIDAEFRAKLPVMVMEVCK